MVNETNDGAVEPADRPAEAAGFWSMGEAPEEFDPGPGGETTPALKLAGALPLESGGFPVMGFLATIYEQIAGQVKESPTISGEEG